MDVKNIVEQSNFTPEQWGIYLNTLIEQGYTEDDNVPDFPDMKIGDFINYFQENTMEPVEKDPNEELIEEYKKMKPEDRFASYATILAQMADILDIPVEPGIENEDPYSVKYVNKISDEDKKLFMQLQDRVKSILTVEPGIEKQYTSIMGEVAEIRNEMSSIVNEKADPGIEFANITTYNLDETQHARFVELRTKIEEIKKEYPDLFANEQLRTFGNENAEEQLKDMEANQMDDLEERLAVNGNNELLSDLNRFMNQSADERQSMDDNLTQDQPTQLASLTDEQLMTRHENLEEKAKGEDENSLNNQEKQVIEEEMNKRQESPSSYYELLHDDIIQDSQQDFGLGMKDEEIEAAKRNIDTPPRPIMPEVEHVTGEVVEMPQVQSNQIPQDAFKNLSNEQLQAMIAAARQAAIEMGRRQQQAFMNPNNQTINPNAMQQAQQFLDIFQQAPQIVDQQAAAQQTQQQPQPQTQTQQPTQEPQDQTQEPQDQTQEPQEPQEEQQEQAPEKSKKDSLKEAACEILKPVLAVGGFGVGYAAGRAGGVFTPIGWTITGAKTAAFVVHVVNKRFPNGPIAKITTGVKNKCPEKLRNGISKVRNAIKKSPINAFVNGLSVGFVAGRIMNRIETPNDYLRPQVAEPETMDALDALNEAMSGMSR